MDKQEFLKEQFLTLRDEAKATKARLFWIVAMGLFGVPLGAPKRYATLLVAAGGLE